MQNVIIFSLYIFLCISKVTLLCLTDNLNTSHYCFLCRFYCLCCFCCRVNPFTHLQNLCHAHKSFVRAFVRAFCTSWLLFKRIAIVAHFVIVAWFANWRQVCCLSLLYVFALRKRFSKVLLYSLKGTNGELLATVYRYRCSLCNWNCNCSCTQLVRSRDWFVIEATAATELSTLANEA